MQEQRIRTVQQTSKIWKFGQLMGVLTFIGAASTGVLVGSDKAGDHTGTIVICILAGVAGLGAYFTSRMLAWWFHG